MDKAIVINKGINDTHYRVAFMGLTEKEKTGLIRLLKYFYSQSKVYDHSKAYYN
jgi:hypothetical protein